MRPRIAAAQDELVAAREPAEHPAAAGLRIPVEAEPGLDVVGVLFRDGRQREPLVAPRGGENLLVEIDQAVDRVAGQLVSDANRQRQARVHAPLVLREHERVRPVVVVDLLTARQRLVDVRRFGVVVHVALQRRIPQEYPNCRDEPALHVDDTHVHAELEAMVARHVGERVLELVGVVEPVLRDVDRKAERGAVLCRVEAGEPELGDLDRRDLQGHRVHRVRVRAEMLVRDPELVGHPGRQDARPPDVGRVLILRVEQGLAGRRRLLTGGDRILEVVQIPRRDRVVRRQHARRTRPVG